MKGEGRGEDIGEEGRTIWLDEIWVPSSSGKLRLWHSWLLLFIHGIMQGQGSCSYKVNHQLISAATYATLLQ